MTDTLIRNSDTTPDVNPYKNPHVKAALDALNAKRATGWRPPEAQDYGEVVAKDFLGRPIVKGAPASGGFSPEEIAQMDADNKAWIAAHKVVQDEPKIEVPPQPEPVDDATIARIAAYRRERGVMADDHYPTPTDEESAAWLAEQSERADATFVPFLTEPGAASMDLTTTKPPDETIKGHGQHTYEGRSTLVAQRVIAFELTPKQATGVGAWILFCQDGPHSTHKNTFREFDMLLRQAIDDVTPIANVEQNRGKRYKCDFEITWKREGGWCTVVEYKEPAVETIKDAIKPIEDRINEAHAATVANRPASEYDTFDKPDEQPKPSKRPDEANGAAPYIRNHVKKHYQVAGKELNAKLKDIFEGMEPERFINESGVPRTYAVMDAYDAAHLNGNQQTAPTTPPIEATTKGNTEMAIQPKTERSNVPETGSVDASAKTEEIREKFTMDMRGKDYLVVQGRVALFRLAHPDWTIETDVIALTDNAAVFKATIKNADGRVIATGHGRATEQGTKNLGGRYIEKSETAAIGRALALAGFGTDDSLDDRDYLADSPVAKAA